MLMKVKVQIRTNWAEKLDMKRVIGKSRLFFFFLSSHYDKDCPLRTTSPPCSSIAQCIVCMLENLQYNFYKWPYSAFKRSNEQEVLGLISSLIPDEYTFLLFFLKMFLHYFTPMHCFTHECSPGKEMLQDM